MVEARHGRSDYTHHSAEPAQPPTAPLPSSNPSAPIKRGSACRRCRLQKIKCDGQSPACSNCVKAGVSCIKSNNADADATREYTKQLERRVQWLEELVRRFQPNAIFDQAGNLQINDEFIVVGAHPLSSHLTIGPLDLTKARTTASLPGESPAASTSSQIGPSQPLAHDVGLLSLANSTEPKYLGPSSGVPFARLIFSSAPQSQGLSSAWQAVQDGPLQASNSLQQSQPIKFAKLPNEDEMSYFVSAYFEVWHTTYPFLMEDAFQETVERVIQYEKVRSTSNVPPEAPAHAFDMAQTFLVLSLGAKVLETRLSIEFQSEQYYATAMFYVGNLQLHDSIRGVQVLLLLVLCSFSFANGLNAWFLTSTIIASCLDLGLQRKHVHNRPQESTQQDSEEDSRFSELRSGIFWSAYSLDRTLSVILGRPLTLRDEACDIEYPGEHESEEIAHDAVDRRGRTQSPTQEPQRKRPCLPRATPPYLPAIYSFRFDRITAEVKLMIYRVARSPARFPWPTDLEEWQEQTHQVCKELLEEAKRNLKWRGLAGRRGTLDGALPLIELKCHQCIMLLYRPSPAFPQPSNSALKNCYESAVETIRIQSDMQKFAKLINSWLTAHSVFVSGITILYCLWTSAEIRRQTTLEDFLRQADACSKLLNKLGKSWSVAENAQSKFERLVQVTSDTWKNNQSGTITPAIQTQAQQQTIGENGGGVEVGVGYQSMENLPLNFWEQYNTDYTQGPNMIMDELGDMGGWFDLEWLGNSENTYQMGA
ncbi:hypothetical protein BU24DRAFT_423908 [Aaosphaeria arxii CBS 175.79]|uniref:Zn(2)-C6 fungal-type domain-containing protein n=1 Tax=Aaosphaeria arxii CBS 175.79 TaxID=1450172 RepID=A0A6A5XPZ9_9PLEO|nr:uncharacterized protein BU24DRAFT_423908 [Aaosphaeria arxii CBS 175.79]KAF2014986.1 hypothetical protein BU24DRAFT_423908 [Aaosphaeria arxii CBS 175.79]